MPLITTIAEMQEFVKISFSNATNSLPNQLRAERRYLVPILGQTLYDNVVTNKAESAWATLVLKCRAVSAPTSYLLALPTIQSAITDAGIRTFENENQRSAHRWEYEEIKRQLEEDASYAIEDLIKYLVEYTGNTWSWTIPTTYKLIFKKADDFALYAPLHQPYRTFEMLRVVIRQIEDQYIRPYLGDTFFEELRDVASPSAAQTTALTLAKKAVANLTIARAIETLSVRFSPEGFTVLLQDSPDRTTQGQQLAPDNQLRMALDRAQQSGETYLEQLKEYLNETASDSVFATYYTSDYYTAPPDDDEEEESPNASFTGVFGL